MKRIDTTSLPKDGLNIRNHELVVLSTYFTSKRDPQRNFFQAENDFQYIKRWYDSILEHNLIAFVFYDIMSDDFINKYQNLNVRFIKCRLGSFSLNDERFFIYSEFLEFFSRDVFLLATDINDVIVNKNPLKLFKTKRNKLFVGRSNTLKWRNSIWNLERMYELNSKLKSNLPSDILLYPVFNAGLLGGRNKNVKQFLTKMTFYLEEINDSNNYNMAVFNFVLYKEYYKLRHPIFNLIKFKYAFLLFSYTYRLSRKIFKSLSIYHIQSVEDGKFENDLLLSGFPFNSMFKWFENKSTSKAYLIHK